ncbi:DUF1302 domain-containing protein [Uliginosibacterium sediminicola]|uniref:DUF1302 family protein n=1 Tax=Uliginosibacterium sediminicola TaxID=2024550 RepID=A0ABU9Z0Q8_9RHOO
MLRIKPSRIGLALAACFAMPASQAFQFDTGDSDFKIRWDNTLKFSTIYRTRNPDNGQLAEQTASPSGDGNRNFKKGIASRRLDLSSELDVTRNDVGGRLSVAGWYDDVYQGSNDNSTTITHNRTVGASDFSPGTTKAVGGDSRLMDAFIFFKGDVADMPGRITLGRHAVVYGETLMSGSNGIANAQGAVDVVKAATVPGAQVKEFILPTEQVSGTLQLNNKLSVGSYYQLKWHKSPFFPAGSFLSPNDFMGDGAQALLSTPAGGLFPRDADQGARDSGQWGMQMRYKPDSVDVELGLYAANYHDKTPSAAYLDPVRGSYRLVYQQDIRTYGASASTVLWGDNVSLETSIRDNQPLTGGLAIVQTIPAGWSTYDNDKNPAYAVGRTAHASLVDIHLFQPNALLRDGGSLATQLDWHTVMSVKKNAAAIDSTTDKSAARLTVAFTADYFQVFDGLDLSFPIVWSRDFNRSRVYVGWVENGGSIDTGVNFTYRNVWKGGLNYHRWIGAHGTSIGGGSFSQTMWDRNYVTFNVSRSF